MIHVNPHCDCKKEPKKSDRLIICERCRLQVTYGMSPNEEYYYGESDVKKKLINSAETHHYLWKDKEGYEGFKTEEDKALFMRGVKKGFEDALFWICDEFGLISNDEPNSPYGFFDTIIRPLLNPPKENKE